MGKWDGNKLVADEPKAKEKSILELLKEISNKLDAIIENTTPADSDS
jgi:hypothetical protein